jgi:hypothetical protein
MMLSTISWISFSETNRIDWLVRLGFELADRDGNGTSVKTGANVSSEVVEDSKAVSIVGGRSDAMMGSWLTTMPSGYSGTGGMAS